MMSNIVSNILMEWLRKQLIDLRNEFLYLWDELNKTFWDKDDTIVLLQVSSFTDKVSKLFGDLRESLLLLFDFFSDKNRVNSSLEGAFKCNMRGGSSH